MEPVSAEQLDLEDKEVILGSASEVSSDEEADAAIPSTSIPVDSGFCFHNFGYHLIPFHDLLESFNTLRKQCRTGSSGASIGESTASKNAKKSFDIKEFQRTKEVEAQKSSSHKISRFRPVELKWDGTMVPDKELTDALYRTPQSDPSGTVIFSVIRDEAKGAVPWKLPERDRDLPVPTLDACNPRLQQQILAHMNEVITKVEREYKKAPSTTQQESTIKASMGADLDNLRRQRDALLKHITKGKKKSSKAEHASLFGV